MPAVDARSERTAGNTDIGVPPVPDVAGPRRGAAADDPLTTGPQPAVSLLDGRLRVHDDHGVLVLALDGGLDRPLVESVVDAMSPLLADVDAVILDLADVALLDEECTRTLIETFRAATVDAERCLVTSRFSGRMVLERCGGHDLAMFSSAGDALQARTYAAEGYGPGWH